MLQKIKKKQIMKKLLFSIATSLVIVSCGNVAKEEQVNADSTAVVVDSAAVVAEPAVVADSAAVPANAVENTTNNTNTTTATH